MLRYFQSQIQEIKSSRTLQWYGIGLFFSHLLTVFFWWSEFSFEKRVPICWPFFPNCQDWASWMQDFSYPFLSLMAILSFVGILLFIQQKVQCAYWIFLIVSAMKLIFHLLDYRFMGNYHYMSHIINFTFLFLLNKTNTVRLFVVLFYMSAGMIKFNTDWLSGMALVRPSFYTSGKILEILCAYVIFLELFLVLFLLSEKRALKFFAIFNLCVFHLFSWHIVGYFYPLTMFCLLCIFVLPIEKFSIPKSHFTKACLGIFALAQFYPAVFEPNSSLNGRGRILSLNMLDAYTYCETHFVARFEDHWVEHVKKFEHQGVRIHCDSVMVADYAQKTCKDLKGQAGFKDMDLDHQVRRVSDPSITEQITLKNICSKPMRIGWLGQIDQESAK